MSNRPFYAKYWEDEGASKPDIDPLTPAKGDALSTLLRERGGGRVVDAGCGSGTLLELYADAADEVVALDVSEGALKAARKRGGENVTFKQADLEDEWPVKAGWADVVVSSEVIEHLFEFRAYMMQISRALKPGGRLYLTTPYHGRLKNVVLALRGFDHHFCNYEGGHIRFFSNPHLERLAHDAGLAAVRFSSLGRIPALAKSTVMHAVKR